jgi:hypothetical protein
MVSATGMQSAYEGAIDDTAAARKVQTRGDACTHKYISSVGNLLGNTSHQRSAWQTGCWIGMRENVKQTCIGML